jgi:hypothetical protein
VKGLESEYEQRQQAAIQYFENLSLEGIKPIEHENNAHKGYVN